jgi:hypothetical protein
MARLSLRPWGRRAIAHCFVNSSNVSNIDLRLRNTGYATGSGKHNYRPEDRGGQTVGTDRAFKMKEAASLITYADCFISPLGPL